MPLRAALFKPPPPLLLQPGASSAAAAATAGAPARPLGYRGMLERLPWYVRVGIFLPVFAVAAAALAIAALMLRHTFASPDPYAMGVRERGQADVRLADLPPHVAQAVLAAVDRRFFAHSGVDPSGFVRETWANLSSGRVAAGGATLTQQLATRLTGSERRWTRKLDDLAFALWLETRLTKHQVLELYLNTADFGAGAFGIEAAAQRTFDKSAHALTLGESAIVAGLLDRPLENAMTVSPDAVRMGGRIVLARMREAGLISAEAERGAAGETIAFASAAKRRSGEADAIQLLLDGSLQPRPARETPIRIVPGPTTPAYPMQPIDADVIEQALNGAAADQAGASERPEVAADAAAPQTSGSAKPAGLMSLGAPH